MSLEFPAAVCGSALMARELETASQGLEGEHAQAYRSFTKYCTGGDPPDPDPADFLVPVCGWCSLTGKSSATASIERRGSVGCESAWTTFSVRLAHPKAPNPVRFPAWESGVKPTAFCLSGRSDRAARERANVHRGAGSVAWRLPGEGETDQELATTAGQCSRLAFSQKIALPVRE